MPSQNDAQTIADLAALLRTQGCEMLNLRDRIREMHERILRQEAEIAMLRGTMAQPTTDEPTTYADNLPPTAPPHGERPPDNPK